MKPTTTPQQQRTAATTTKLPPQRRNSNSSSNSNYSRANRCLDSSNTKYRSSTYTCSNPCIEREKGKRVSRSIGHSVLFYFLLPEVGRERKRTRVKNSVEKKKKAHPPYLIHRFVLFCFFPLGLLRLKKEQRAGKERIRFK